LSPTSRGENDRAPPTTAPRGAGVHGITWADVDAKYHALVPRASLPGERVEASFAVIHDFRRVAHISQLIDLLS
jgi:hypothetical protein